MTPDSPSAMGAGAEHMVMTTTLPKTLADRTIGGYNIEAQSTFSDVVGSGRRPTMLVFLRHYG